MSEKERVLVLSKKELELFLVSLGVSAVGLVGLTAILTRNYTVSRIVHEFNLLALKDNVWLIVKAGIKPPYGLGKLIYYALMDEVTITRNIL